METREELNRKACLILERAKQLAVSRGACETRSDVVTELRKECEALRSQVKKLKLESSKLPAPPIVGSRDEAASHAANLLLEEARLGAELTVLQRQNRTNGCSKHEQNLSVFQTLGVTTRDGELRSLTYQQVCESCSQQDQLLMALRSEKDRVEAELKREEVLLKESHELETALEKKLTERRGQSGHGTPDSSAEAQLRGKASLAEESIKSLRENLVRFCMDEIIQPSDDVEVRGGGGGRRNRKKKKGDQGRLDSMLQRGSSSQQDNEDHFLPLPDVVQELISKTLSSPHSPYIPLPSIWPPHANLLLRSGVIQRHPDNPSLVRVTPFHL